MDTPHNIRAQQLELGQRLIRIGKKVYAQSLVRHPEDWTHLPEDLEECAAQLEELLGEIKKLPHNL